MSLVLQGSIRVLKAPNKVQLQLLSQGKFQLFIGPDGDTFVRYDETSWKLRVQVANISDLLTFSLGVHWYVEDRVEDCASTTLLGIGYVDLLELATRKACQVSITDVEGTELLRLDAGELAGKLGPHPDGCVWSYNRLPFQS